jgi:hypothetical protein
MSSRNQRRKGKSAASNKQSSSPKKGGQALSYAKAVRSTKPRFSTTARSTVITHRELVKTVVSGPVADAFTTVGFPVNPGMAETFPWLSRLASNYEKYKFHKLVFRYVTRAATTDRGGVIMAPDYDAADAPPTTEEQASAYTDAVESPVWQSFDVPLRAASQGAKYVRSGAVVDTDIKTYDIANFFCATVPATGATDLSIGKLWVEYVVELMIPQLATAAAPPPPVSGGIAVQYNFNPGAALYLATNTLLGFTFHEIEMNGSQTGSSALIPLAAGGVYGPVPSDGVYLITCSFTQGFSKDSPLVLNTLFEADAIIYTGPSSAQVLAQSNAASPRSYHYWQALADNFGPTFSHNLTWVCDGSLPVNRYFALTSAMMSSAVTPGEYAVNSGGTISITRMN